MTLPCTLDTGVGCNCDDRPGCRMPDIIDWYRQRGLIRETHNHVTRDIKATGTCPACDRYHEGTTNA